MGYVKRLLKILVAKIRCHAYCIWRMFRHYDIFCEFSAYDKNGKLILIAATKDSLSDYVKGKSPSLEKVFYFVEGD